MAIKMGKLHYSKQMTTSGMLHQICINDKANSYTLISYDFINHGMRMTRKEVANKVIGIKRLLLETTRK